MVAFHTNTIATKTFQHLASDTQTPRCAEMDAFGGKIVRIASNKKRSGERI